MVLSNLLFSKAFRNFPLIYLRRYSRKQAVMVFFLWNHKRTDIQKKTPKPQSIYKTQNYLQMQAQICMVYIYTAFSDIFMEEYMTAVTLLEHHHPPKIKNYPYMLHIINCFSQYETFQNTQLEKFSLFRNYFLGTEDKSEQRQQSVDKWSYNSSTRLLWV